MVPATRSISLVFLTALVLTMGQDAPAPDTAPAEPSTDAGATDDATKNIIEQLTITLAGEVVDERTILIRDAKKSGKTLLRLGNLGLPEKGEMSDDEYQAKIDTQKGMLEKLLQKQMIWYKAAPDDKQLPADANEDGVVLADVWLMSGQHVNTLLHKEGHLVKTEEYTEELARDILTAEADEKKKEAYKELEQALKENEAAKAKAAKEKRAEQKKAEQEARDAPEPMGITGWVSVLALVALVVWAVVMHFIGGNKKVNLNRKRGPLERFFMKLKGA